MLDIYTEVQFCSEGSKTVELLAGEWNVVTAPSVQAFESSLDKAWKDQLIKFN